MSGLYVGRAGDAPSVGYLRLMAVPGCGLQRIVRAHSRNGQIQEARLYNQSRQTDPAGSAYYERLVEPEPGLREWLAGTQVSLQSDFARAARVMLTDLHYVFSEGYYQTGFKPIFRGEEVGTARVYARLPHNKLFGKVAGNITIRLGDKLNAFPPVMWDYLDQHLLPLLPEEISGMKCYYSGKGPGEPRPDAVVPFQGAAGSKEAIEYLTLHRDVKDELSRLLNPSRIVIETLLAENN